MNIFLKREKKKVSSKSLGFQFGVLSAIFIGWIGGGLSFDLIITILIQVGLMIGAIFLFRWIMEGTYIVENKEQFIRMGVAGFIPFYLVLQLAGIGIAFIFSSITEVIFLVIISTLIFTALFYLITKWLIRETPPEDFIGTFILFYPFSTRIFIALLVCIIGAGSILFSVRRYPSDFDLPELIELDIKEEREILLEEEQIFQELDEKPF